MIPPQLNGAFGRGFLVAPTLQALLLMLGDSRLSGIEERRPQWFRLVPQRSSPPDLIVNPGHASIGDRPGLVCFLTNGTPFEDLPAQVISFLGVHRVIIFGTPLFLPTEELALLFS
ncbi:hypothetical protein SODALDRAFT_38892 [Sodiomyces alkalinus F11]|uniref:Uncharacterized protein n=1 Tax=Sodiomyces alkalinus (strain CBS 110278 / VKM F-3762 / F11) TaxID=1314773 RepID=A0A3N2Q9I7_SODAK|nr:hypothetical protein SODALDRAFT_38892 [Sodiomyces alkalinus F11]ROT43424.1 hypothetical protein SODALDRAFT_38892 [Sodiomyces alkalinus F11]